MVMRLSPLIALGLLTAACAPAEPSRSELVKQGEDIAVALCSRCHAVGREDEGAHPETVPFRRLSWIYPLEFLAEPLAEGIIVGHPDMPVFQFEPEEIDALIAYLETIQEPQAT